jgi:propionate CoA-transferase
MAQELLILLIKQGIPMRLIDKIQVLGRLVQWRLTWDKFDIDHLSDGLPARFMSARQAAGLITEGATVLSCGLASNARCSIFYRAVRERFRRDARPSKLTWVSVGAQGGRARVPGTVEELAEPGLLERYISGHVETAKALLRLAESGQLELHLLPQGEMTHIIEAQGRGETSVVSRTGIDTFLDPRCGRGSPVRGGENLVSVADDRLRFHLPRIQFALINAPYADRRGNVYFRHAATLTESIEAARAARHNGGKVLVAVSGLVPEAPDEIAIPAESVDAIVINPGNEQTGGIPQLHYWPLFTTEGGTDDLADIHKLRFANDVLGFTPLRGPAEQATARLGAQLFTQVVERGSTVNLGVGYGEELVRVLCEQGLHKDVTFTTETGVYGGVPAPGVYFGAAVHPQRLESSAWMFHHYRDHLAATVLGFLEVDSEGNVNGSERGDRVTDLVGPGGLPSIVQAAPTIIFIGGWMKGADWKVAEGKLILEKPGQAKFVERVRCITFSAKRALADGKRVFYVTPVGVFRLTSDGLLMTQLMPGVDLQRDVLDHSEATILLPADGPARVSESIVTGRNYRLHWPANKPQGESKT